MLIIERKDGKWEGRLYKMHITHQDHYSGYEVIDSYDSKEVAPLSGWDYLVTNLYNLDFI